MISPKCFVHLSIEWRIMEDTKKLKENLHQMIDQTNDLATLEAI